MSDSIEKGLRNDALVSFSLAGAFIFAIGANAFVKHAADSGQFRTKPKNQIETSIEMGVDEFVRGKFIIHEPSID